MKPIKTIVLYIMLSPLYIQCSISNLRKAIQDSSNNQIDYNNMNQNLQKRCDETGHGYIDYTKKEDTVTYYINGKKVTKEEFDNPHMIKNTTISNTSTHLKIATATTNQSPESKPGPFKEWMARRIAENEKHFTYNSDDSDSDSDSD